MDMLMGDKIVEANLADWRKLAQGLHTRYVVDDFGAAARFVAAVGEAGDALGHHPIASIGKGYVDLKLISDDAIYREDEGTEHVVEWVTQQDVDLARRITEIAADHKLDAEPASVSQYRARSRYGALRDHRPGVGRPADRKRGGPGPRVPERRDPGRHGTGTQPVVRGRRRARDPASAVPRRGLRGARGGRATDRRRPSRRWNRRR